MVQTKFVLKRKWYEVNKFQKYKGRLVVCGSEEVENNKNSFSPLLDATVLRPIMCLSAQRGWCCKHPDFQNALSNKLLNVVVLCRNNNGHLRWHSVKKVMRLNRSHYSLKDFWRIYHNLLNLQFAEAGLTQLNSALCLFQIYSTTVIRFVDILLILILLLTVIRNLKKAWNGNLC